MSTMEALENQVTALLAERPLEAHRSADNKALIEKAARKEIQSISPDMTLFTDHHEFTSGMRESVINGPAQTLSKWMSRCDDAITSIRHRMEDNDESKHNSEVSKLEEEFEKQVAITKENFIRKNDYSLKKDNYLKAEQVYVKMNKAQGGKAPIKANHILYFFVMVMFSSVEFFINYSTFNEKYAVPTLAVGSTLLLAVMFAIAGHFQGKYLKQRLELVGPSIEQRKKRHQILILVFSISLALIALAAISIVRQQVIADEIVAQGGGLLADEFGPQQSPFELLIPFLLMNVLVWFGGIAISYFLHDAIPGYQEAYKNLVKARKEFNILDDKLQDEITRHKAEHEKNLEELVNSTESERIASQKLEQLAEKVVVRKSNILRNSAVVINDDLNHYQNILTTVAKSSGLTDLKIGYHEESIDTYRKRDIRVDLDKLQAIIGA